ncbi:ABC transporter ATP-binding protein [Clostridium sp. M62/1]|uniref:ABC transporter ATP-binding protein n=1 Tax=Clostridium sp. M62/1 TaxID=411486 RepID=UPI0001972DF4|nr:ABC transporter ATP-binding protein [Clostridium sp. M62/1]EFE11845.1 ABC transporter, ATP-binding protein [Clostridium sp. M62/1]UEB77276.1 ABC transporter ATP-binding protein [Clostridium sp. M62/1]
MNREDSGLSVEQLRVSLQGEEILRGLSLRAERGAFVSLLGESGCGKSTLLKSIAGLIEAASGEIRLDGRSLLTVSPEKRGTVIVFQDLRLFPHMTVEKNIAFPMELRGLSREQRKKEAERLLDEVQLTGYGRRKIRELSGGQMQRVALARALAAEPSVLLLDEPFSGLDERLRAEMGSLVRRIHRERKITTILVTHDSREALQMSDRIVLMKEGSVLQCGTPEELFWRPASWEAAEYFGRANYLRGTAQGGIFDCGFLKAPLSASGREGECEAMVRPFSIKLTGQGDFLIREIIFMGETAEILLDTPQGEIRSQMMSREFERLGLKKGSRAGIEIEEAYCI